MTRQMCTAALAALLAVVPSAAQVPDGWRLRADRSTSASDPDAPGSIKFVETATGFHATNPQAAVFWHPANVANGEYSLKGNFTLVKPSNHTNFYGLVFGGSNLDGPQQSYLYFLVAQDGTWLIKRRVGNARTEDIVAKTSSGAVNKPDPSGSSTNALEVRVLDSAVEYLVNGVKVHTMPKSALPAPTDGLFGVRVNHQLEVRVDNLTHAAL